jgi:DNA repair protein RecN (Recombination protein N)
MLKTIGDVLVDIHGQHAHQSLLSVERHADILDAWCGSEATELKTAVADAYAEAQKAAKELAALQQDARERARTLDLLAYQRDEIDNADPKPDEEEGLMTERVLLANAERLHSTATNAYGALYGGASGGGGRGGRSSKLALSSEGGGALDALTTAVAEIEHAARLDERLAALLESLQNALFVAEDAAREVRDYRDGIEFNPQRLEEIENRLDVLKTLKRKYGDTLDEVRRYRQEIGERLETLENAEERIATLQETVARTQALLRERAERLTAARQQAATPFAQAIMKELGDLAMTATRFEVAIEPREPSARGADHVEFLISPNPGVPLKPLAKIASGGEISRVMLALKSVLSRIDAVPTLIFDEIDTGIGGRTATVLAEKLAALSQNAQILCITHLAQIAAKGNHHFFIEKRSEDDRTVIRVVGLDEEARVQEIARMLGGTADTDSAIQYARQMLTTSPRDPSLPGGYSAFLSGEGNANGGNFPLLPQAGEGAGDEGNKTTRRGKAKPRSVVTD